LGDGVSGCQGKLNKSLFAAMAAATSILSLPKHYVLAFYIVFKEWQHFCRPQETALFFRHCFLSVGFDRGKKHSSAFLLGGSEILEESEPFEVGP